MSFSRFPLLAGAVALAHVAAAFAQNGPGTAFRDCAACPEMVVVPSGSFLMGAAPGEEDREQLREDRGRSEPQVTVAIGSFALGRYEVTHREFAAFVAETGHATTGGCHYVDVVDLEWRLGEHVSWSKTGFGQGEQHPVVCVSWNDAQAYADWLSRKTGKGYRLPSEAEWEYGARAGTATGYWWGRDIGAGKAHCFACDTGLDPRQPTKIGRFGANPYGLYDTAGNVEEWVYDCWHESYEGAPSDGAVFEGGDCGQRVVRGGAYSSGPKALRSMTRGKFAAGTANDSVGFRVVRD